MLHCRVLLHKSIGCMKVIEKTISYVRDVLGVECNITPFELTGVPFYIRDKYQLYTGEILSLTCVFMRPRIEEDSPAMIEKHTQAIRKVWSEGEVIYLSETIAGHNRNRLIQHKVSFIVPGNQFYIPVLGIELREYFKKVRKNINIENHLSPTAQLIVLWTLLKRSSIVNEMNSTQMSKQLRCSRAAAARAYDELVNFDWAKINKTAGNQKVIRFKTEGSSLWQKVNEYMKSPVKKSRWVIGNVENIPALKAGEYALSQYTLMGEPNYPCYAIAANEWKGMQKTLELEELKYPESGCFELQTWSYNPDLLAEDDCVDLFSLYLSLQDKTDPRIEKATEELIEGIKW